MLSGILSLFLLVSPVFADEEHHHSHPTRPAENATQFGEKTGLAGKPVPLASLVKDYDKYKSQQVLTTGTVTKVCEKMGCWVVVKDGETQVRITMKDNGFAVPKAILNKKVVAVGNIQQKDLPAKVLRHYLKDEGKTDAEIEKMKIDAPQTVYLFDATGIKII